jgi:hypothetical protein
MKKLTDQELDSVFKNAAEGYQPAFDQSAWEAMNVRLDSPKPAFWKRWMPFAFVGLLIFSAGVWVGTYLTNKTPTNIPAESKVTEAVHDDQLIIPQGSQAERDQKSRAESGEETRANAEPNVTKRKERITALNGRHDSQTMQPIDHQPADNKAITLSEVSKPIDEATFLFQQENVVTVPNNSMTESKTVAENKIEKGKADSVQTQVNEEAKKKELTKGHALYLRLLASPDFTSINYASANEIGSNYSVLMDYKVTNRWSISTGVIWSMKTYSSDKEFTYGAYTADRMAGDCRILDVPINVYYQFRPLSKLSFYPGLGLSSYFMLEEDYTYTFDTPSGSRDFSSYYERENIEWFKMLNVSFGVQYQFAPRFHVQVEPFLKAPLAGVGEWDVELSSLGVFMGLKYKINQ